MQELGKIAGLRPLEAAVFRRWYAKFGDRFDRFDYNVRIGSGRDPGPEYSEAIRRDAVMSSQLRMDAVGWRGDRPTLIEVKHYALANAVPQLALYAAVWHKDKPELPAATLLLVCGGCAAGVVNAALDAGMTLQAV